MGSDEAGRLLIYTYVEGQILFDPFPGEDLIELSASLQRRFPDQVVERPTLTGLGCRVGGQVGGWLPGG